LPMQINFHPGSTSFGSSKLLYLEANQYKRNMMLKELKFLFEPSLSCMLCVCFTTPDMEVVCMHVLCRLAQKVDCLAQSHLEPMLRLIPLQHFLLPQGTCNCYFQTINFHCLRPRPHSLSSTNISLPFSPTTSSFHLQLVLVFTHLFLMLETCHHYSHTQTQ